MDNIEPTEAAILAQTPDDDEPPQELTLVISLRVLNERRLRRIAADRMSRSGFDLDPADHVDGPLHELVYQAMFGSNPDPLDPDQLGIEIVSTGTR